MSTTASEAPRYYVIHPLDDLPEEKRCPDGLAPMKMSRSVRVSLMALQGYLLVMGTLIAYRLLDLSGVIRHIH